MLKYLNLLSLILTLSVRPAMFILFLTSSLVFFSVQPIFKILLRAQCSKPSISLCIFFVSGHISDPYLIIGWIIVSTILLLISEQCLGSLLSTLTTVTSEQCLVVPEDLFCHCYSPSELCGFFAVILEDNTPRYSNDVTLFNSFPSINSDVSFSPVLDN